MEICIWELSHDILHVVWKYCQIILWTVVAALRPCVCSLFLLFLFSLSTSNSNLICKELLQVIATLLKLLKSTVTATIPPSNNKKVLRLGMYSVPTYLYSYITKLPTTSGVDMVCPSVLCSILHILLIPLGHDNLRFSDIPGKMFPGDVMYKWKLSTHIICRPPPLMQLVRHGEGQESVVYLDLVGRLKDYTGSLTRVVFTRLQQFHTNEWWAVPVSVCSVCCSNLLQFWA